MRRIALILALAAVTAAADVAVDVRPTVRATAGTLACEMHAVDAQTWSVECSDNGRVIHSSANSYPETGSVDMVVATASGRVQWRLAKGTWAVTATDAAGTSAAKNGAL